MFIVPNIKSTNGFQYGYQIPKRLPTLFSKSSPRKMLEKFAYRIQDGCQISKWLPDSKMAAKIQDVHHM